MATKTKYVIEGENRTEQLFTKLDRDLRGFDRQMQGIRSTGLAVGAALAAALGGAKLVGTLREFGTLEASLRTVTGSAGAAQEALSWIEPFAATTPFQLEEVVGAFVKLEALGLKPSEAALRSYGNTASAMGKSLDQFIEAVADATTGEFERLKEFGIKTKSEGDRVTFTFRGMATEIGKDAESIERFLRQIGEVEFAGAMEERAATLDGALSNLEDSANSLLRAMGDSGLTQVITDSAKAMSVLAGSMADAVREGDGLLRVFEGLGNGLAELARGDDVQRLGDLENKLIGLEERLGKLRALEARPNRSRLIERTEEEIERVRREIEGLKTVLQPFEFGAAPNPGAGGNDSPAAPASTRAPRDEKAAAREAKAFERLVKKNAELQREFERDLQSLAAERVRGEEELTRELRESQEQRLQDLEGSLLTEREAVQASLEERLQLLRVARAQELDTTMEFSELERRVREDAAREIAEIEKRELEALKENGKDTFEELTRAVQGWGDEASEAILDFVSGTETSFGDMVNSILRDIARLAIRKTITDPLGDFIGGALKNVFSSSGATASRAGGGPVFRGQPTLVGELGPELFVPPSAGTIMPSGAVAASNVLVQVINPPTQPVVREEPQQDGRRLIQVAFEDSFGESLGSGRLRRAGLSPQRVAR